MSIATTLLIIAVSVVIVFWVAPKLVWGWRAEKSHHKQLVADRKDKEGDFPD